MDANLKLSISGSPLKLYKKCSLAGPRSMSNEQPCRFTPPQEYLHKDRRPGFKGRQRTCKVIKFHPLDPYATVSDSDDEEDLKKGVPAFVCLPTRTDSMATLADKQPAKLDPKKGKDDPVSEDEQDVTTSRTPAAKWHPEFFQRHHKASSAAVSQAGTSLSTSTGYEPWKLATIGNTLSPAHTLAYFSLSSRSLLASHRSLISRIPPICHVPDTHSGP